MFIRLPINKLKRPSPALPRPAIKFYFAPASGKGFHNTNYFS